MKRPLALLFAITAMAVLLGMGSMMNSACKTSHHAWCDPTRQGTNRSRATDSQIGHSAYRVRLLSQR